MSNISRLGDGNIRRLADPVELARSILTRDLKPLFKRGLIIDTKPAGGWDSRLELTEEGRKIA
ncbi:MAG: hypothetical protein LBR11_07660 [Deltaproteobacteria bacterium]|nr:hypothetical protein [Deltaproteobacteria bacterium]